MVELSRPLTSAPDNDLWGEITIHDLSTGTSRVAHLCTPPATSQAGWQAFSQYTEGESWSPDGLYLAYWDLRCSEESDVPAGAVCFSHEVAFLAMRAASGRKELVLSRYSFDGWLPGQPHTVIADPALDGNKVHQDPFIHGD